MNNLKRTLSLALAGVMTLGVMTVSASAAEFTDAADIENATAVNTMAALGVITGREDGSFDPNGTVNRAEMATMIAKALNGGKVPSLGLAAMNYFSDVKADQWFAEAVNYCYSLGIITGRGDGTFDPSADVTGWEAAKMMLVAMGYDSTIFGFTGSTWNTNVDYYATNLTSGTEEKHSTVSLYSDVDGQRALPFTRNDAAQLIYNGMNANTITKTITGIQNGAPVYSYNMYSGSLLENNFGAKTVEGILTASSYSTSTKKWTYNIGDKVVYSTENFSDLYMHNVLSVYDKNNNAYGISTMNSTVLFSKDIGNKSVKSGKLNGFTFDKGAQVYALNADAAIHEVDGTWTGNKWDTFDAIDNDGDGKVDVVVTYPTTVEKITAQDKNKTSVTTANGTYKYNAEKDNDATTEDELKVGDFIQVTPVIGGNTILTKIALTEDAYQVIGTTTGGLFRFNGLGNFSMQNGASVSVGNSYKVAIIATEWDKWLVGAVVESQVNSVDDLTIDNVLYAYEYAEKTFSSKDNDDLGNTSAADTQKVRVYFADGTSQIINVVNVDKKDIGGSNDYKLSGDAKLYSYVEKNGNYTLTSLETAEDLNYDNVYTTITNSTIAKGGVVNGGRVTFADNGIFFVTYKNSKGNVVTEAFSGKQIKAWKGDATISNINLYGDKNANGIYELGFGVFTLGTKSSEAELPVATNNDVLYAFSTSDKWSTWDADTKDVLYAFTAWNGTEEITLYIAGGNDDTPDKGCVFAYEVDANGHVTSYERLNEWSNTNFSSTNKLTNNANTSAYVSAIAGDKIWLNGGDTAYTLTDDTKVIYVTTTIDKNGKVTAMDTATEGSIGLGVETSEDSGEYYANVTVEYNSKNEIVFIVVDTAGHLSYKASYPAYVIK